jgi:hypothetical protein
MLTSMEERFKQEEAELLKRKRETKSEAGVKSEDDGQIKDEDLDSQLLVMSTCLRALTRSCGVSRSRMGLNASWS